MVSAKNNMAKAKKLSTIAQHAARHETRHAELLQHAALGIILILMALLALDFLAAQFPQGYQAAEDFVRNNGLPGVFLIVFIGSSFLPFPTDLAYSVAIKLAAANPLPVIAVAIVAAFFGSMLNYFLAYYLRQKFISRFITEKDLKGAEEMFDRYGPIPIVLLGVIPASPVFDPLTFVAGLVRMDVRKFAMYSFISRVLHFGLLAAAVLALKLV